MAVQRRNREFLTYTGSYHGLPVSVIATGIGAAASAIAIVEAAQCVAPATFIRLGSTGALQDYINLGDLVITTEALREEHTTRFYAPAEVKATAHPQVLAALQEAAAGLEVPYHVGVTCTSPDFYAGQGRVVPGFPTLEPDKVARLSRAGVLNLEMEMSAYLTLAQVSTLNLRAGGACVVVNNRIKRGFCFGPVLPPGGAALDCGGVKGGGDFGRKRWGEKGKRIKGEEGRAQGNKVKRNTWCRTTLN